MRDAIMCLTTGDRDQLLLVPSTEAQLKSSSSTVGKRGPVDTVGEFEPSCLMPLPRHHLQETGGSSFQTMPCAPERASTKRE